MPLSVRTATEADEAAAVPLWRACGLVTDYNDPVADFHFALGGAASTVLVGVNEEGRVLGSVMVGHDGHRGWLYYVSADPAVQGSGIGREMVTAAEGWLRERGVPKAMLLVRETNTAVVSFYERLGFAATPRVVMAKALGP